MRNPARIDEFCKEFAKLWHNVPDWRFGQLISNVFGEMGVDPFFPEDDETIEYLKKYFENHLDK